VTAEFKDRRKAELARIHIAKAKLGMDDDTYRDMLWTVARERSAGDLDDAGRARVLDHLRGLGFDDRGAPPNQAPRRMRKPPNDKSRLIWKARELCKNATPPRDDKYLDAMAHNMFHVEQFIWCTPAQLHSIVAALVIDAKRQAKKQPGDLPDEPQRA